MVRWCSLLIVATLACFSAPIALAQGMPSCQFVLGFAALASQIPTTVGTCTNNQSSAANGDATQNTTKGLMVWRKGDNFTAFTNGAASWVNGPYGVQERPNGERFSWEANPNGLPVVGSGPSIATHITSYQPSQLPVVFSNQGISVLGGAKITSLNGGSFTDVLAWLRNDTSSPLSFVQKVMLTDTQGRQLEPATASITDLQPGEVRLVDLRADRPLFGVSGLSWLPPQAFYPGKTTPAQMQASGPQFYNSFDPSTPAFAIVTVRDIDSVAVSGIVGVAILGPNGAILDLAESGFGRLEPGAARVVICKSVLKSIPQGSQLRPQFRLATTLNIGGPAETWIIAPS